MNQLLDHPNEQTVNSINLGLDSKISDIANYLQSRGLLSSSPSTAYIEKPGEGNMNLVLRFVWEEHSLILKQSKPYVNKYPGIPAPEERIATEAIFYQYASRSPQLLAQMPEVLYYDPDNHLIAMQDLGKSKDFLYLYEEGKNLQPPELNALLGFLSELHSLDLSEEDKQRFPDNLKLRQLNHQHIFALPFQQDNGFGLDDIQPGLQALASEVTQDQGLKAIVHRLGESYLAEGNILIHGDYYPGSWMQTDDGLFVIDPEFGFIGSAEFELGVFIAHLLLSGHPQNQIEEAILQHYHPVATLDMTEASRFAGVEIIRRLIGIAQLPLDKGIEEKASLLSIARQMILS